MNILLKDKTLQEKIENFDITNEEYSKLNEILKVDEANADEFKMYFIDDKLLHRHWNISTMFFQKDIAKKFDDFDYFQQNFTMNKITKEKAKLKLLQDMKIQCECLDPYDITPKKVFDKKLLDDYKIIFRNRAKTLKADTIYDCQKIIVGIYKKLFGDIIDSKQEKGKKKGSKYIYEVNNEALIQDKKLFEMRKTISDNVKFVDDEL
jgi:hypothetical protein